MLLCSKFGNAKKFKLFRVKLSPNWPTGPIWSSSCGVRPYPAIRPGNRVSILSPSHAFFSFSLGNCRLWTPNDQLIKRRLLVMDLFRDLINKRPSELCVIDQNSEEVHNLQSSNEKQILVLLSASVKRFGIYRMQNCFT